MSTESDDSLIPRIYLLGECPPGLAAFECELIPIQLDKRPQGRFYGVVVTEESSVHVLRRQLGRFAQIIAHFDHNATYVEDAQADDIIEWHASASEWRRRLGRLSRVSTQAMIDRRLLATMVHDLRTPLNVISLSSRMIEEVVQTADRSLGCEYLSIMNVNISQLDRLLYYVNDYLQISQAAPVRAPTLFGLSTFANELFMDERSARFGITPQVVLVERVDGCPTQVIVDKKWASLAILYAVANARSVGEQNLVHVRFQPGGKDRWRVEVSSNIPPREGPEVVTLTPERFNRLAGTDRDRHGLDLAIVAMMTQLSGGEAYLKSTPGIGSTIILDWPLDWSLSATLQS